MRKPIIAANWKMNMTAEEAADFHHSFRLEIEDVNGVEIVIAAPFTSIPKLSELLGGSQKVRLGAQNFYFEKAGAFTGEISATMLRELFVRYVIVGHSERRQLFGETDELIQRKVAAALASELRPILCVGETLETREAGQSKGFVHAQLMNSLPTNGADGTVIRSFTILTTNACPALAPLHARMPVVLERADWGLWLGEATGDPAPLPYLDAPDDRARGAAIPRPSSRR